MTYVPNMRAQMIACIMDYIPLNFEKFVLSDIRHIKNQGGPLLMFPSLITKLCKRAGVEEDPRDTWVCPKILIYLLNIRGEGTFRKIKNRKVDLGKSVEDDMDSSRPSFS